jgi:salicylate hydroxylase
VKDCNVLIVGGGLGGLTAALSLQHFGFRVSVFEQAPELREVGAGLGVSPSAMRALEFLGVDTNLWDLAGKLPEAGRGGVKHYQSGEILGPGPRRGGSEGCTLHRADLQSALRDALLDNDPDCIRLGHCVSGVTQDADGVAASFTNGEVVRGDVLVGCDGVSSVVRELVFGGEQVQFTDIVSYRTLIPADKLPPEVLAENSSFYIGPSRMLLLYFIRGDEVVNVVAHARQPGWEYEGWSIPADVAEFQAAFDDFHPVVRTLISWIPPRSLFKWALRDRPPLDRWVQGRVAMLGDAAHPILPFLGQGANMAMEDGLVLGRCFAEADTVEPALQMYEAARKPRANAAHYQSREQAVAYLGLAPAGAHVGQDSHDLRLYEYDPVTVALSCGEPVTEEEAPRGVQGM